MKKLILMIIISCAATTSFAERLLSCSTPDGSGLQEVDVFKIGTQLFRTELNFAGAISQKVGITAASWARKDLRWVSRNGGKIHLFQVTENSRLFWRYEAVGAGMTVQGFCEE